MQILPNFIRSTRTIIDWTWNGTGNNFAQKPKVSSAKLFDFQNKWFYWLIINYWNKILPSVGLSLSFFFFSFFINLKNVQKTFKARAHTQPHIPIPVQWETKNQIIIYKFAKINKILIYWRGFRTNFHYQNGEKKTSLTRQYFPVHENRIRTSFSGKVFFAPRSAFSFLKRELWFFGLFPRAQLCRVVHDLHKCDLFASKNCSSFFVAHRMYARGGGGWEEGGPIRGEGGYKMSPMLSFHISTYVYRIWTRSCPLMKAI